MLMTLGMIDLGRAFVFGVATQQGAREAARYASRYALSKSSVSDTLILQRLIDASLPSLAGCAPVTTHQSCAGGTWTLSLAITPPGSGTAYDSLARAVSNSSNPDLSGGQVTVTASGAVAMLGGYCLGQQLCLPSIGVQGQASMEFM
jgi:hypothetical protein